jgi:gamma-glutamyltranspeptidase/glutathione hydrolase
MYKYLTLLLSLTISGYGCRQNADKPEIIEGPGITARNGMVVSAHPEATRIGVKILMDGGNAYDAAVATGFALAVCYPEAGNLGGGGYMVLRSADGKVNSIDFREKAPNQATRDMFLTEPGGDVLRGLSTETHFASGVPGSVDGLIEVHRLFGSLPFRKVIQPAIELAEKGFPLPSGQAASLNGSRKDFLERNLRRPAFVNDSLWKEGDILKQPELAATLRLIRDKGREGFYSGKTADLIVKEMRRGMGLINKTDLADYRSLWRAPLKGDYRGYNLITVPPSSSGGITLLQLLSMIEKYPMGEMGFHNPDAIHIMVEAEKRAFADRSFYLGDPEFVFIPVKELLSRNYLEDRFLTFNPEKATPSKDIRHGSAESYSSEETTHYSVVDGKGNAVSATTTLNGTFGSCIVVDGAGFLLNNEMDDFSVKPGYPNMYGLVGGEANAIRQGKRMLSSMTPAIVEKEGKLRMVAGSPGGSTIPTSVFQVIINTIDFGMDIQEAVNAGRFHHQWLPDYISYETGSLDSLVIKDLEQKGHIFRARTAIGRVNAIARLPDGSLKAGADPRGNNAAAGY